MFAMFGSQTSTPDLHDLWIQRPPRPDDRAGWKSLVAEAEADDKAVLELHHDQGFRAINAALPSDPVIYVAVPLSELESFTINVQFGIRPFWIID